MDEKLEKFEKFDKFEKLEKFEKQRCNTNTADAAMFIDGKMKKDFTALVSDPSRKVSSGTLNRLILVAQALESEVDSRRKTEIHGGKIVVAVRMANIMVLVLINFLVFTGFGQYHDGRTQMSLMLTPDKWMYTSGEVPHTFKEMKLSFQYMASTITVTLLFTSCLVQLLTVCRIGNHKVMSVVLTMASVPCCLFVFGLQMHYSSCPWLDEYYRTHLIKRGESDVPSGVPQLYAVYTSGRSRTVVAALDRPLDPQCGINGWALAGIFTLLSCALFVAEGLVTSFFRQQAQFRTRKHTML